MNDDVEPRRRLRIAYVGPPSSDFAGIERVIHELATGLMEAHGDVLDIHVLYSCDYDEEILVSPNYKLHVLNAHRLLAMPRRLRAVARQHRFDVIVLPQVELSVMGWLAVRGLGVSTTIGHLHGNPRLEEADATLATTAAFFLFRHWVSSRMSAVFAVNPSLARYAAESLSGAPVVHVKNPVRDLGAAARGERAPGPFRFVSVARLSRQKGQDVLIRALAIARPELPPVVLQLVGGGPLESELRDLATELGVADIVDFVGYVSDPERYLADADTFVLASRWDGSALALCEALQFGLPLLATDCDFGPADIITDPRIGEIVAVQDPAALAAGLVRATHQIRDPIVEKHRRMVAATYYRGPASKAHFEALHGVLLRTAPGLAELIEPVHLANEGETPDIPES